MILLLVSARLTRQMSLPSLKEDLLIYLFIILHVQLNYLISATLDIMAGDLSKLNELFYEDPLIIAKNN